MQPGVTLRDLVHAIPYYAIQQAIGFVRILQLKIEAARSLEPWQKFNS